MALEDDVVLTAIEIVQKYISNITFVGVVQNTSPMLVIQDGTDIPIPVVTLVGQTLSAGNRVIVSKFGSQYVVLGVLAGA